jgi:DNA-directed RNA polymerase sigma subunit (sigma70/sigma32)
LLSLHEVRSLNESPFPGSRNSELADFVEDRASSDVADTVVRSLEAAQLLEAINKLTEQRRYVLARRYGLGCLNQAPVRELSEELAVSQKRVLRMQSEAERALRTRVQAKPVQPVAV